MNQKPIIKLPLSPSLDDLLIYTDDPSVLLPEDRAEARIILVYHRERCSLFMENAKATIERSLMGINMVPPLKGSIKHDKWLEAHAKVDEMSERINEINAAILAIDAFERSLKPLDMAMCDMARPTNGQPE